MNFFDPRGNKTGSISNTAPVGDFYAFTLRTEESAPTGNWRAVARVGDRYFDRVVKIENIAPNRLRMDMALPEKGIRLEQMPLPTTLSAQWLSGASAASLKADVQLRLSATKTSFEGLDAWQFDDKARNFTQEPQNVFEGALDDKGKAVFDLTIAPTEPPPGALSAVFTERVFEPGGQFSTQYNSATVYPFANWVGLQAPTGKSGAEQALTKDAKHTFELLSIDGAGKPVAGRKLSVTLYEIEWRWWWENQQEDFTRYISDEVHTARETRQVSTDAEGRARWTLDGTKYDWGRFLVRVCDAEQTGAKQHCASQDIYLGWGYGEGGGRDAATRISLGSDKRGYEVGETASIQLPAGLIAMCWSASRTARVC